MKRYESPPRGGPRKNELVTIMGNGERERRRERITTKGIQSFTVLVAVLVHRKVKQNDQVIDKERQPT